LRQNSRGKRLKTYTATTGSAGTLVCVGVGITLGSHITPLARSYIEKSDVVFVAVSDAIVERWIEQMHGDVRSLQSLYRDGKSRMDTYQEMVDVMLAEVRAGKKVCAAFYGHPGIFAWSPHQAIARARAEGFAAHMEPGISAADCLYADLGIDPGQHGCQHYEASQLLFYERRIDASAYLVLWQVGVVGDQSLARFSTGSAYRGLLRDLLALDYPLDHEIIVYRAATLPILQARIERHALGELAQLPIDLADTIVLPPAREPRVNKAMLKQLELLDRTAADA
jgi:siroheme synthase